MPSHIVVIDDESVFSEYLVTLLRRAGYDARSVEPGHGATRRLAEAHHHRRIDLLISDLFMPEPDGFEVLRFAQANLAGVPVFGMSGKGGDLLDSMRKLGAAQVFQKPTDGGRLVAEIGLVLGRGR